MHLMSVSSRNKDQQSGSYGDSGIDGKGGNKGEQSLFDVGIGGVKKSTSPLQEKGPEGKQPCHVSCGRCKNNEVDFFFKKNK